MAALERAARVGAWFVAAVGVIALCGWAFGVEVLRQIHPTLGVMKVNAAIAFVLAGAALVRISSGKSARALSGAVSIIGVLTLVEYMPGFDLGIDDLLFADEADLTAPGRMSATTAATFVAIGIALYGMRHAFAQWLALAAGLVSLLAVLGSVYGQFPAGGYEEVALHPAATMIVIAGAILCARPTTGLMRIVASEGPGGTLARRLLPAAVVIPAVIGSLLIAGEQTGLFDVERETALFAAASIVCFTTLVWWTAYAIAETKRQADAALEKSQRIEAVGRLAGGIAHDFNNLLTVIITYGYLIQRRAGKDDPGVREMVQAAHRASDLTRQLLALSRRQVLQPTVIDLAVTLDAMAQMLRHSIGEDVDLEITTRGPIAPVFVDSGQLEQVILNLVVNARDAMPRGGRISITLDHEGDRVRLTVRDTGTGMDAQTLAQIFEPYFTTKDATKGTGLGLPTALGIVEQSGGSIRVSSELGTGTAFEVLLPRHAGESPPAPRAKSPVVARTGTETILLVEDDDQVRVLIAGWLREHGYTVHAAATPGDALLIAEQQKTFDLLLTDVVMPRLGGRELSERIRQLVPEIRILFMSGHADDVVLRHGVVAFIGKPIQPDALLAKLREVLDHD
ncbi:MAG: ATP-binding protein [Kofleriaceae bacterium]